MAHFAKLDENNKVIFITVGRDEDDGKELEISTRTGEVYKQTSYNTRGGVYYGQDGQPHADQSKAFRKNYAGIGFTYDSVRDAFIPPKPFDSWSLNEQTCLWEAPLPRPEGNYFWSEHALNWIQIAER